MSLPRIALSPDEAAEALGISRDTFDRAVGPYLAIVRVGRRKLIPVRELERWVTENAHGGNHG
jgi:excisionase family DNA binding protein